MTSYEWKEGWVKSAAQRQAEYEAEQAARNTP